jgi:hypothetical protein
MTCPELAEGIEPLHRVSYHAPFLICQIRAKAEINPNMNKKSLINQYFSFCILQFAIYLVPVRLSSPGRFNHLPGIIPALVSDL